jgi:hypothetical protein
MKGIALTSILAIGGILIVIALAFAMFTGGQVSTGLFGWQGTVLEGVEEFFTSVYNTVVVLSSWMSIGVLTVLFVGIQGVFIYGYYKLAQIAMVFQPTMNKILKELTEF